MKKVLINSILIFILGFLLHSLYNYLPCFITLILLPVNESIFEHLKMIYTSYILLLVLKYLFFNKRFKKEDIFLYSVTGIINIIIFLIIYLPINYIFKENLLITLIIYFISIILSNTILIKLEEKKAKEKTIKISLIGIFIVYLIFTIFTLFPPKINFFYDTVNKKYGTYNFYD